MKVLIDTNILLDALIGREPYYESADKVLKFCADKRIQGVIAAHSVPNMFYILRKDMSEEERREVLLRICKILTVEGIDQTKIVKALKEKEFSDFEDCLQAECAVAVHANYIVTRNADDFARSSIPCVTAEELCEKIAEVNEGF